jgi:hypothetical protein
VLAWLGATGFLFLSDRYQWFAFNQFEELTAECAVTTAVIVFFMLLLWLLAALVRRLPFQFTSRSLLLLLLIGAIHSSWIAVKMQRTRQQREGIALVERLGGNANLEVRQLDVAPRLTAIFPDVFFKEVQVIDFDSKNCSVSDADLKDLVRLLPSITGLRLSNTRVTDAGLEHLVSLKHLGSLDLENTSVTDSGLEHLAAHELWSLCLKGTPVTDDGLFHIHPNNLLGLDLGNTRVTDAGLAHLRQFDQLQGLSLSGTAITNAGIACLEALTRLRHLDLRGTDVTDDGVKNLQQALPNCEIVY